MEEDRQTKQARYLQHMEITEMLQKTIIASHRGMRTSVQGSEQTSSVRSYWERVHKGRLPNEVALEQRSTSRPVSPVI